MITNNQKARAKKMLFANKFKTPSVVDETSVDNVSPFKVFIIVVSIAFAMYCALGFININI